MLHVLLWLRPLWCYTHNVEFAINALILSLLPLHSPTSRPLLLRNNTTLSPNPYSDKPSSTLLTKISKLQPIIASRHEVVNDVHCSNHKEGCKNFNCAIVCNIVHDNNFLKFWFDIDLYLQFFPPSLPLPLQFIFQILIYI